MRRLSGSAGVIVALTCLAGAAPLAEPHQGHHGLRGHAPQAADARDGNAAIRQEFRAAKEEGTAEALVLFIRRHPDHPLADRAKELLENVSAE